MPQYSIRSVGRATAPAWAQPLKCRVALAVPQRELKRTVLAPSTFRVVWWSVFGFHLFCATFTFAMAVVHALLARPDLFEYSAASLEVSLTLLQTGAVMFSALAFTHCLIIGRMIYRSIGQRQLSFVRLHRHQTASKSSVQPPQRRPLVAIPERRPRRSVVRHLTTPWRLLYHLWRHYFSIDGLYGLNGKHFDIMFTAREVLEMLSQLFQAYLLSVSVTTHWINRFAIAVVVVNSVSSLVIRQACSVINTSVSTRHLAILIADVALDFCSSMIIPLCILYQVVNEFDWTTMTIPPHFVNSDEWLIRRIAEVHLLIVTSGLDLVSTLALHLGVVGAMQTIARALRRDQPHGSQTSRVRIMPMATGRADIKNTSDRAASNRFTTRRCILLLVDLFFLSCGLLALAFRLQYQRDPLDAPFCLVHVDAWFVRKFPCAVVRINCHRFHHTNDSVASILQSLDDTVLVSVNIVHCANPIKVPLELQAFGAIRQLKFINVSSIAWAPDLVLDETHFPHLTYVMFGCTNMSNVPSALLHDALPSFLREIEWSFSNLSELPGDVGRYWGTREWFSITFDHTKLKTLPQSFGEVPCRHLSLVDTQIEALRDDALHYPSLRSLDMSYSPVTSLPPSLTTAARLEKVLVEHSQLMIVSESLLAWTTTVSDDSLSLYGSPACTNATVRPRRGCDHDFQNTEGVTQWDELWPNVPL